jgi:hypothetical protein
MLSICCVQKIVSDLLAIKLGTKPNSKEAHSAVRKQLDQFIAHDRGRAGHRLGCYVTEQSVLLISDKILSEKYLDFYFGEEI